MSIGATSTRAALPSQLCRIQDVCAVYTAPPGRGGLEVQHMGDMTTFESEVLQKSDQVRHGVNPVVDACLDRDDCEVMLVRFGATARDQVFHFAVQVVRKFRTDFRIRRQ